MNLAQLKKAAEFIPELVEEAIETVSHPGVQRVLDFLEDVTDERPPELMNVPDTLESRIELERAIARAAKAEG